MTRRHSASLISRKRLVGTERRIVEQHVDRAELLDRRIGDALAVLGVADVAMTTSVFAPSFSASWATLSQAARSLER